ncbi:hypothetical protein LXL04_013901 [Taraxacum kok-saghyz]
MRSIKVLPESVRSSLRSGIILSDLTRVVEELVFNSLDAGATKVIVAVGVGTNYIKVTDNGCGITRDGLVLVGERYATCKFEQLKSVPESFGFRGEALSSISDVSLLQVVTKAHGMPNGYCKVIKCSKCLYLGIDDDRQDVGTTVVVRDLFYNQPVRRRHLQSSPKKVLHSVKECILRIALVHLGTCFKLIDIESGDELLSLYPSSSPLPLLVSSFGTEVSSSLHELNVSDGDGKLKLSGFISGPCETFSVKAFQYFYINSRYISKGPIHKLLNQLATDYNNSSDLLKAESGKRSRWQTYGLTYILNLSCPRAHYDLSFEPTKTCAEFKDWDPVIAFIKKTVSCFWSQDTWNGADALSTRADPVSDCGLAIPKKKRSHQTCIVLSPPQLQIPSPREEPKHMPFSDLPSEEEYASGMDLLKFSPKCKSPFDDDGGVMKPFLRSCSSTMDLLSPVEVDEELRFEGDGWLNLDDGEFDNIIIQGSDSEHNKSTVWSPPRIMDTDSSFLSKGSFHSPLTHTDHFTSSWPSPVACCKSSHQSPKFDWSPFKFVEEAHTDERNFKLRRDKWFDLFAHEEEEEEMDVWDLYDKNETCIPSTQITQDNKPIRRRRRRRSHSAPPSYKGKRKFMALNTHITVKPLHNHTLQEASHVQKSSGVDHLLVEEAPGPTNDLQFQPTRHDKKRVIEGKAANSLCLDLYNTDSDFTSRDNEDFGGKWRSGYPWACSSIIEKKHDDVIYEDSILDISSGILHLSGDSLLPKSITKKCLDDSKVLPQVDKKFIPIVGAGILAIIDQHAADERIRLEDLRKKVLSGKMKTVCYLDAEQELVLPEIGYQLLNSYSEQIKKWGWICNFHAKSSDSFKKNLNFLHNQPSVATLIAVPCILGVNLTDVHLLEFLKQLADTDGSSIIPPAVLRVLNTKACRGAIMFGDALLPSECSLIVEELKKTSLCFQCAHGRPTTVPLVDLVVLHKQIAKLGNWNHGSCGPWHGLTRHRPTLERATQRLGQR